MTRDLARDPVNKSQAPSRSGSGLSRPKSFQIKGVLLPLTLLDIRFDDLELIQKELSAKVDASPGFFNNTPIVFGLEKTDSCSALAVDQLVKLSSDMGFIPTGIKGGTASQQHQAEQLKLAIFPAGRSSNLKAHELAKDKDQPEQVDLTEQLSVLDEIIGHDDTGDKPVGDEKVTDKTALDKKATAEDTDDKNSVSQDMSDAVNGSSHNSAFKKQGQQSSTEPEELASESSDTAVEESEPAVSPLIIDTPVRSGQQIFHKGDLIVLASVSHGAELLSEGNIHIYGALRGRALAGVRGNENARVFCSSQEAELISIAGHFIIDEQLKTSHWRESVQVFYNGDSLVIKAVAEC